MTGGLIKRFNSHNSMLNKPDDNITECSDNHSSSVKTKIYSNLNL